MYKSSELCKIREINDNSEHINNAQGFKTPSIDHKNCDSLSSDFSKNKMISFTTTQ